MQVPHKLVRGLLASTGALPLAQLRECKMKVLAKHTSDAPFSRWISWHTLASELQSVKVWRSKKQGKKDHCKVGKEEKGGSIHWRMGDVRGERNPEEK